MAKVVEINNSFKITKQKNYVKLSAEAFIEFENIQDESQGFSATMPKDWEKKYLKKLNIEDYCIYYFILETVRYGHFNAITDNKKVWGLCGINSQSGMLDCSYESLNGKTYLGIIRTESVRVDLNNLSMLIPKGDLLPAELIKSEFAEEKYELSDSLQKYSNFLATLQRKIPNSVFICGGIDGESKISLNIYANDIDELI